MSLHLVSGGDFPPRRDLQFYGPVPSAISRCPSPPPAPRPPAIILSPNDIYRGPPLPPDRPDFAPRSEVAPPMERAPPLPPMSPRIGN